MSVRAVKPRRLTLSPIAPPSPACSVMPGTLRKASVSVVAACASITARLTTLTVCGMSRSAASVFAPTLERPAL